MMVQVRIEPPDATNDGPSEDFPQRQVSPPSPIQLRRTQSAPRRVSSGNQSPRALSPRAATFTQASGRDEAANFRPSFPRASSPGSMRRLSERVDFNAEIKNEARRLFASESVVERQQRSSLAQEPRWGGSEAQSLEHMAAASAPSVDGAMAFAQVPGARRISRQARPPGERPWLAFCYATSTMLCLWTMSTAWAIAWRPRDYDRPQATMAVEGGPFTEMCAVGMETRPLSVKLIHARRAKVMPTALFRFLGCNAQWAASYDIQHPALKAMEALNDVGCGLQWPVKDASIACHHGEGTSPVRCVVALLRRGGRAVTFCHVRQYRNGKSTLTGAETLRIAPSAQALQQIALMWPAGYAATRLSPVRRSCQLHFRIFARTSVSGILALTAQRAQTAADMPQRGHSGSTQCRLTPLYDVEPPAKNVDQFILSIVGRHLLTIRQQKQIDDFAQDSLNSCSAGTARDVVAWDTSTGERKTHHLGCGVSWWLRNSQSSAASCARPGQVDLKHWHRATL